MPLSPPAPRDFLTRRTITCDGYVREDGLLDIEGRLLDQRGYDMGNDWRGVVKAGEPAHEMWVRLTIDDGLIIRAVESVTDAAPFPTCREIAPNMQRLVGLKIAGGFKQEMRVRVGNTQGCTHVVALLEVIANVAIQAMAGKRREQDRESVLDIFNTRDASNTGIASRPALIDSCHSYAADGPVVQRMWPMHYRPRKP
ncbi:MAG TPA: DUF2889 domain-containing protein [Steroidobacteraceae bacterium]|jgi:hypothetical protein